ncbi:hypothetical protein SCALM49S_10178 [Streptomyces californicus]
MSIGNSPEDERPSVGRALQQARIAAGLTSRASRRMLVSENNTSYGKDLGDIRLLETLLRELPDVHGDRAGSGVSYLQPRRRRLRPRPHPHVLARPRRPRAGLRPLRPDDAAPGGHAGADCAAPRCATADRILDLLDTIRQQGRPRSRARSNIFVGFPVNKRRGRPRRAGRRVLTSAGTTRTGVLDQPRRGAGTEAPSTTDQARRGTRRRAPSARGPRAGRRARSRGAPTERARARRTARCCVDVRRRRRSDRPYGAPGASGRTVGLHQGRPRDRLTVAGGRHEGRRPGGRRCRASRRRWSRRAVSARQPRQEARGDRGEPGPNAYGRDAPGPRGREAGPGAPRWQPAAGRLGARRDAQDADAAGRGKTVGPRPSTRPASGTWPIS